MSIPEYTNQAKLTARLGASGLARAASSTGTLDAEALTRITNVCADVNAAIDAAIAGLGIDTTTPPAALEDIAARLAIEALFAKAWSTTGVKTPKNYVDDAAAARAELAEFQAGGRAIGEDAGRQVAARFRYSNVADNPSDTNPRRTLRARMRRLF